MTDDERAAWMTPPPDLVRGCNTPEGVRILADWLDEHGGDGAEFREQQRGIGAMPRDGYGDGLRYYYGLGDGSGYGSGEGDGYGRGDGYGYGYAYGYAFDPEEGDGHGHGVADGYGNPEGDGGPDAPG